MVKCHDCGCGEGALHKMGCDNEKCPFCGGQLISCSCVYKILGPIFGWEYQESVAIPIPPYIIDVHPTGGLPNDIFQNGLTDEMIDVWNNILERRGRVPFVIWPNLCARCGMLWPEMFRVSDEEWEKYVELGHRKDMLCFECYQEIKNAVDRSQPAVTRM